MATLNRRYKKYLDAQDLDSWEVVRKKNHPIIELRKEGRKKRLAVADSLSDRRGFRNFQRDIRCFIYNRPF